MKNTIWHMFVGLLAVIVTTGSTAAGPWQNALTAYQEGDFDTAIKLITPLAEAGNIEAQDILSDIYVFGEGVPIDHAIALSWSRRSAALGSAEGENSVATSYARGEGVRQDRLEALKWYHRAADHGNAKAQVSLARRYLFGEDVKLDEARGLKYLRAAAANGRSVAQVILGQFTRDGKYGIPQDAKKALRWFARAAENRYAPAQLLLADIYFHGIAVPKDKVKAMMWLSLAARRGCVRALELKPIIGSQLNEQQLAEASRLTKEWDASHPPLDRREHDDSQRSEYCKSTALGPMPRYAI